MATPCLLQQQFNPTASRSVRVDLGCGRAKAPELIGVDRFPMPGVDVVADLDAGLPFADDSVELIYASHSLEHVRDLPRVMRELYRISKHGAQLCIVAPYDAQGLNHANPYHFHVFNEHTPRFWTTSAATPINPEDFAHPHARAWGLLESDNRSSDIDFRCVKMEFFYFPAYRGLPQQEQRRRRRREQDVCDQIVYHLLVVKRPVSDEEFHQMADAADLYESPYVAIRRLQERCEALEAIEQEARAYARLVESGYREVKQCHESLVSDFQRARAYSDKLAADYHEVAGYKDKLEADCRRLVEHNKSLENDCNQLRRQQAVIASDAERFRAELLLLQRRLAELEASPRSWRGRVLRSLRSLAARSLRRAKAAA